MGRNVGTQEIVTSAGSTSIAVASTAVVYTKAFKIASGSTFSLSYLASSATGSPSLKIELEQCWKKPTTEGASDTYWAEAESATDIEEDLTTETIKHKAISPVVMEWARLKITGGAENPADTILKAWLHMEEYA